MALRAMRGFHRDEEGHWVADLACGHTRHVRHRPPFELRPWVETEEGRASMLGVELECGFCDMPTFPEGLTLLRRTRTFDETTVPDALTSFHTTKAGVWGRIVVDEGRLEYEILEGTPGLWVLRPGVLGIIAPELPHRVRPLGEARFHVELWRTP